jgi:hypothetical protein
MDRALLVLDNITELNDAFGWFLKLGLFPFGVVGEYYAFHLIL